ncbi:MAG: hypothetical protein JST00_16520 [Deltaproteobacteria bacterium]|nr:hypothetical protein [Deltaproteobacteria bacterium]
MRHLAVVLVAAAAIHCGPAEANDGSETASSGITAPEEQPNAPAPRPAPDSEGAPRPVQASGAPVVTSTVTDASGATYTAGTFTGLVTIGGAMLQSRGEADVFLMKQRADGTPVWARAIGSRLRESAPRIAVDAETGRVTVVGMTAGEMDCGGGPLPTFAETFFLCTFVERDGEPVSSGSFPTGRQ